MAFSLDKVVPWGRSYQEYVDMFALNEADLQCRILGCGDGPASFNAEHTSRGGSVTSLDPIYIFTVDELKGRISETYETVIGQMCQNAGNYVWTQIPSVEALGELRLVAMAKFLADFEAGKEVGRYVPGELPTLPFPSNAFDLVLSSHFLFLYSEHLTLDFHIQSLEEMLRAADEVRVFPLLGLDGKKSPHLNPVQEYFKQRGLIVEFRNVSYEFQRGGFEMLVIKRGR